MPETAIILNEKEMSFLKNLFNSPNDEEISLLLDKEEKEYLKIILQNYLRNDNQETERNRRIRESILEVLF